MTTEVFVLFDGYAKVEGHIMKANCSCTLVKSRGLNILVDTMTPWDKNKLINALEKHDLKPEDLNFIICTHGHSDHVGNNNLFLNATHIFGKSVSKFDEYDLSAFENDKEYNINESVTVLPTPGHTLDSISVKVSTSKGIIFVAGDLFEREEDLQDEKIWKEAGSEDEQLQIKSRNAVLQCADYIIPGHGPMFKVSKD